MKKHFLIVAMAFFAITSVTAQDLELGISAGVDAARLTIAGATGGPLKFKSDLAGGINFEAGISKDFAVQIEAIYSRQGTAIIAADGSTAGTYNMDYLAIPVVVKFYGAQRFNFFAGPQLGILLSGKAKTSTGPEEDIKEQFISTSFYAVFGTEYKFANGLFVNARYNLGLNNVVDKDMNPDQDFRHRYFSFRLGYAFKL